MIPVRKKKPGDKPKPSQRAKRLPVGTYSLDIFRPSTSRPNQRDMLPAWNRWQEANRDHVQVIRTAELGQPRLGGPTWIWVLFKVTGETSDFPQAELGFPTVESSPNAQPPRMDYMRPGTEPGLLDQIEQKFGEFGGIAGGAIALLLIWALTQKRS